MPYLLKTAVNLLSYSSVSIVSLYIGNVIEALNRSPSTPMKKMPPISCVRLFAMESPSPLPSVVLEASPRIKRSVRSPALLFSNARERSETFLMEMSLFPPVHAHPHKLLFFPAHILQHYYKGFR